MPMNLTVPKIEVINDKPVQTIAPNGTAGRVGVIADLGDMGVNTEATVEEKINALSRYNVIAGDSYRVIQSVLPIQTNVDTDDYKSLEMFFKQNRDSDGVTFMTIAPLPYYKKSNNNVVQITDKSEQFGYALDHLENEDFDMLVVLTPLPYEVSLSVNNTVINKDNIVLGTYNEQQQKFIGTDGVEVTGATEKYYCDYTTDKVYKFSSNAYTEESNATFYNDEIILELKSWLNARFKNKSGIGCSFALEESDDLAKRIDTRMEVLLGQRGIYNVTVQRINGWTLNQSVAYISGVIAGRKLNKSLTNKVIRGISSIENELQFNGENQDGHRYMNAGVTVLRAFNRRNGEFGVLRSTCPSGYDLAIERSADYMTRQFQLNDYLGESSNVITLDAIAGEINSRMFTFINTLNLCNDIEASILKIDHHTVQIDLKYIFDGIIDYIKVYINIEELDE